MNTVGRNIKKLRSDRSLTQEKLALRLNVTRQAVSLWERGKNEPDIATLEALAAIFDTDITELIYGHKKTAVNEAEKQAAKRRSMIFGVLTGIWILLLIFLVPYIEEKKAVFFSDGFFDYMLYYWWIYFLRPMGYFCIAQFVLWGCAFFLPSKTLRIKYIWLRRLLFWAGIVFLAVILLSAILPLTEIEVGSGFSADFMRSLNIFSRFIYDFPGSAALPGICIFLSIKI